MAVPWGLITFLIGMGYGWLRPGRQPKARLLRTGILIGVVVALVLLGIGLMTGASPLGVGLGVLDLVVAFVVLSLLFILGVWIGDMVEGAPKHA